MTAREPKVGDLVAVYWEDIQGASEWQALAEPHPTARCVDYGRITVLTDETLEIAASFGHHGGTTEKSSVAVYPRGCVVEVVRLREPRAPKGWPVWRG